MRLATLVAAMVTTSAGSPQYNIARTEKGWQLVIQNEHCSVMQVFSTASAARRAVDRMLEFFDQMNAQQPGVRQVA
jgi:hypothetical protein